MCGLPHPPHPKHFKGVTWPSSRFATRCCCCWKAFTLTANNTLLAGLEGPLVKDDPSVRRLMEAPGSGDTGPNNTKGVKVEDLLSTRKKTTWKWRNFWKNVVPLIWQVFLNNKSKGKVPKFWRKKTKLPQEDGQKSTQTPLKWSKVFAIQLLKVLHMSNEKNVVVV